MCFIFRLASKTALAIMGDQIQALLETIYVEDIASHGTEVRGLLHDAYHLDMALRRVETEAALRLFCQK